MLPVVKDVTGSLSQEAGACVSSHEGEQPDVSWPCKHPRANQKTRQTTWFTVVSLSLLLYGWQEEFGRRKGRQVVSKKGLGIFMASSSKQMRDQQGILPSSACKPETKVS